MTDKIITDGVDVSGCEYFCRNEGGHSRYEKEKVCELEQDWCEGSPNCYYKQLQRLIAQYNQVVEQNKSLQNELKERVNTAQKAINGLCGDIQRKAQIVERMDNALHKIRTYELHQLDIEWDEYETCCRSIDYSPIITYCEEGLGESLEVAE